MAKNLTDLKGKSLVEIEKLLTGKILTVIGNGNSANVNFGDKVQYAKGLSGVNKASTTLDHLKILSIKDGNGTVPGTQITNSVKFHNLSFGLNNKEDLLEELSEIEKSISDLKTAANVIEDKLQFLNDNCLSEFSEEEFKVYKILEFVDSSTTLIEKSKLIAKLIN